MRRLIIRPGGIGDTILSFPALEHLRADYTEIWVRSEIVPLIGFADRVRAISSTGIEMFGVDGLSPEPSLVASLGSFGETVTWYGTNRPAFREALLATVSRVRFLDALPPEGGGKHAADHFLEQVGGSGPAAPRIVVPPALRGRRIVVHPFSGSPRKNWPIESFHELAAGLTGLGYEVEWAAGSDWVRFDNLLELANWIAGARLYVGNDSGITHLAAAVKTPVVALFGPTDPAVWAPRGGQVRVLTGGPVDRPVWPRVDEVMEVVREVLADGP